MTPEQEKMLDELIEKGFVTKRVSILDGKIEAALTSVTTEDQLEAEWETKATDAISAYQIHTYSIKILSRVLKGIKTNGKNIKFETPEDAEKYLKSKPPLFRDLLIEEQSKFEKEIRDITKKEELENFTKTPATEPESK
jgi:hypothetical protein